MKKLKVRGIHKRLNLLIEKTGGYDYKYHAKKIAEQYNLNANDIARIMEISNSASAPKAQFLFNKYFNEYKEGRPLSDIEKEEKLRVMRLYNEMYSLFHKREV